MAADAACARAAHLLTGVAQHVLLALDRPIERRALRLSLEGAGIPLEESASVEDGLALVRAAAAASEPFTTLDRRRPCGA